MPGPLIAPKPAARRGGARKPAPAATGPSRRTVLIGAGLVLAVIVGLYFRSKSSAATTQSSAAPAAADTGATGGASGSGAQTGGQDFTPFEDLAFAINGLTGVLGSSSFGAGQFGSGASAPAADASTQAPTAPTTTPSTGYATQAQAAQAAIDQGLGPGQTYFSPIDNSYHPITSLPGVVSSNYSSGSALRAGEGVGGALNSVDPQPIPAPPHNAATKVLPPNPVYVHSPGEEPAAASRYTAASSKYLGGSKTNKGQ